MSTKRVILANDSRLLREMLQRVISKAGGLEVVQEISNHNELPAAIEQFSPKCIIASSPGNHGEYSWLDTCMAQYPTVQFVLLSPGNRSIKMKYQTSYEDITHLSLKDFIHILENDLQQI
jgi:chemotaxis response regulator CheB